MIYIDEVGTPDSSRIWDGPSYCEGKIVENSKEGFRQLLINSVPDSDVLLNKDRMDEREELAKNFLLTRRSYDAGFRYLHWYMGKITGSKIVVPEDPKAEILDVLSSGYGIVK